MSGDIVLLVHWLDQLKQTACSRPPLNVVDMTGSEMCPQCVSFTPVERRTCDQIPADSITSSTHRLILLLTDSFNNSYTKIHKSIVSTARPAGWGWSNIYPSMHWAGCLPIKQTILLCIQIQLRYKYYSNQNRSRLPAQQNQHQQ